MSDFGSGFAMRVVFLGRLAHGARMVEGDSLPVRTQHRELVLGRHVCKVGSRFAALEPVAQGLRRLYGSVEADVARGLALRMDHGSQYLSDHFLNQLRYWGIHPSFGFLEEPETNGVVERWNRTLKEQAVYGRVFRNLADVRAAVAEFVERYNQCWRLEKLAYRTPSEAREEYELRHAA